MEVNIMNKAEMKKEFKERWNKLFPNKRLLAVQLNGFSQQNQYIFAYVAWQLHNQYF